MITWGISGNSHDASLAVFRHQPWNKDSCLEILFASHSERYSGNKNDDRLVVERALSSGFWSSDATHAAFVRDFITYLKSL